MNDTFYKEPTFASEKRKNKLRISHLLCFFLMGKFKTISYLGEESCLYLFKKYIKSIKGFWT